MKKLSKSKTQKPKLCPHCPFISFLPIIMAERITYTRQKEPLSPYKICQELRAFAKTHHIAFNKCPTSPKQKQWSATSMPKQNHGKFWPIVRPLIWEKAQQLYQEEQAKTMGTDFKGITATKADLREGGFFYKAKLIVLRNLW